jgi:hypothetical protein
MSHTSLGIAGCCCSCCFPTLWATNSTCRHHPIYWVSIKCQSSGTAMDFTGCQQSSQQGSIGRELFNGFSMDRVPQPLFAWRDWSISPTCVAWLQTLVFIHQSCTCLYPP